MSFGLLPLREKAAKPSEEGLIDEDRTAWRNPSPNPFGATLSRQGGRVAVFILDLPPEGVTMSRCPMSILTP